MLDDREDVELLHKIEAQQLSSQSSIWGSVLHYQILKSLPPNPISMHMLE
jgi:hypothetical protein